MHSSITADDVRPLNMLLDTELIRCWSRQVFLTLKDLFYKHSWKRNLLLAGTRGGPYQAHSCRRSLPLRLT
ncbi:hypothetical protein AAFF_G00284380 [Aldrovandia affinis]|uniref:Uncharacterized protein n=1 Tax=Aldrovandia affinis TaxID=143900 RepID=A0AAD7TA52_9TELE|nr:hypothetical protein AAFF_G00284380 [Aldrovandia affinis]